MKIKEIRKIIDKYEQKIETTKNNWKIISSYIIINNMTLFNIRSIKILKGSSEELVMWLDNNYIKLKDIKRLEIKKVESHL